MNLQENIRRIIREETMKEKYKKEYINFHGNMEGFDDNWNNLFNKDFNDGGLMNIPEYIELSRLVNIVGEFKKDKNIHWVRTSDEYLFYDTDWLFLSDVKINDNAKIIRIKTHKSNINLEQTIIQNLTFDYEKEITLKNLDLENYEIINMNLQESIRRIVKEETEGIDTFLNEITQVHDMSDELKDFVKKFIEESNCKRINFSKFNIPAMGLALESGVLINSMSLRQPLPFLLFLIFHEVAHQYQFKKYGEEMMYNCYLGEISESEAAKFMKQTEEVADDFAYRKIRQLQKLKLIGPYTPPQMYKNVPIQQITMMVNNYRNDMRRKNIDSPKKVSEYFYNMVKSEL